MPNLAYNVAEKSTLSFSTSIRGISIFILQQYPTLCTRNKSSNHSFRRLPSSLTCLLLLLKTSDMRTSFYFLFLTSLPNFLSSNGPGVERATQLISCVKKIRGPLVSHPLFFLELIRISIYLQPFLLSDRQTECWMLLIERNCEGCIYVSCLNEPFH